MKYLFFFLLLVAVIITAGCVNQNIGVTPVKTSSQVPTTILTITPQTTTVSTPLQTYKTAELVVPATQPAYGFKMDYPSKWTYKPVHALNWRAYYSFSSADGESNVNVYISDTGGSYDYLYPLDVCLFSPGGKGGDAWLSQYMYPLDTPTKNSERVWADNVIEGVMRNYCHDGAGNAIDCSKSGSSASGSSYYYRRLISNDSVIISGNVKARKLVFAPDARDPSGWWSTYYLMHVGKIQGYNFTVPLHPETAVKVDGPVWDYGMGGKAYAIVLYTDQVNASSDIFDHMIKSFEVIS